MSEITDSQRDRAVDYFQSLQKKLIATFEGIDGGAKFVHESWQRAEGGGGTMAVIRGAVLEKAGVNTSVVEGKSYPALEGEHKGKPFFASGVSTICHMANPFAPIGHMNVRLLKVGNTFWFGGGADLTPCFAFPEDTKAFHLSLQKACDAHGADYYARFKKWCDEYFFIPHRHSARGEGGIFFDYLEGEFEPLFDFVRAVGDAYAEVFPSILRLRKDTPFTEADREKQLYWRGRYVEYNLLYDRGTKFGLLSGGHVEAIFVSLPPLVKW